MRKGVCGLMKVAVGVWGGFHGCVDSPTGRTGKCLKVLKLFWTPICLVGYNALRRLSFFGHQFASSGTACRAIAKDKCSTNTAFRVFAGPGPCPPRLEELKGPTCAPIAAPPTTPHLRLPRAAGQGGLPRLGGQNCRFWPVLAPNMGQNGPPHRLLALRL
jgi:hypothetical protein